MAKVLKITKQDKTTHIAPVENLAFLTAYNKRQPAEKKWKIEEVDEADVKDIKFIDESYVTAGEAQVAAGKLKGENEELRAKLAELQKQLEGGSGEKLKPATEVIGLIKAAATADEANAAGAGDIRISVVNALAAKLAELQKP